MIKYIIAVLIIALLSSTISNSEILFEDDLNLKFSINYKDENSFQVGTPNYWIGIGFGKRMKNSDMHVAEFIDEKNYKLFDSYATGHSTPKEDTTLGGTNNLENIKYSMNNEQPTLEYTRLLNTTDKYDAEIILGTQFDVIVAWGKLPLGYHQSNYKFYQLTVSKEIDPSPIDPINPDVPVDDTGNFWAFHGISMTLLWSVFNFVGYIYGRFYRHLTWWIWMHRLGSILTGFLSIGILSATIKYNFYTDLTGVSTVIAFHIYFGLIFFSLIIIQSLMGSFNYWSLYQRTKFNTDFIHKFKGIHKVLGITLTFICYMSIFTGFLLGGFKTYIVVPAIFCGVFLGVIIILEIKFYLENYHKKIEYITQLNNRINKEQNKTYFNLIQLNEEKKEKKFVLYDNHICDVGPFIAYHPGGAMMIQENLYTEIGRYITGTQAYSKNFKAHDHLFSSQQHLITKMAYAELKDNHGIILNDPRVNELKEDGLNFESIENISLGESIYINDNMTLVERNEIAEHTYEYTFKSFNIYKYAKLQSGVFWIGRHFAVSSKSKNKTRYYSLSLTLNDFMKQKHLELLENVPENQKMKKVTLKENEMFDSKIKLYIKRYQFENTLSDYIYNLSINQETDIIIRGPNGIGLNLFDNRLTGTHIVFAAGTGVIPFLDLVAFTLRYAVYKTTQSRNNFNESHHLLLPKENESFEKIVSNTYRLEMFVAFANPKSSRLIELCEALNNFDKKFNLNIFTLHTRISSENRERWNEDFLKRNLSHHQEKLNKVYIVGPVPFMDDVKRDLVSSNMAKDEQIILV